MKEDEGEGSNNASCQLLLLINLWYESKQECMRLQIEMQTRDRTLRDRSQAWGAM